MLACAGLALALFALGACSGDDEKDKYVEEPVNTLYNRGMDALAEQRYPAAAKAFDEVERQHPYSIWATKAQLMSAYALYQDNNYQEAINALTRFIQLHPGNRDIAYAYYLKALSYYEQVTDVERDQTNADQALTSLEELIRRYPDTPYAKDARRKIDLVRDHLAGKELEVGRFYETRGAYVAAISRFKTVVDKYQTTTQVPEALHRLVECYMALGVVDEAKKTAAVLGYNYPRSQWYVDSYQLVENVKVDRDTGVATKNDDSFIAKTWNSINLF
ncbi:MAG TPA: outer membrane protein assembly factor BamD [Alphaproteobacteria bacterium]|jgi:outer membrane protein assembly factor BamD|nr:outer membrane protein assembly factor BamD [Alphaproteobacteria bacterium]